jgi:hypothetical protein
MKKNEKEGRDLGIGACALVVVVTGGWRMEGGGWRVEPKAMLRD